MTTVEEHLPSRVLNSARAPRSKSVLLDVIHELGEFDIDTLIHSFATRMDIPQDYRLERNVRGVVIELATYGLLGFSNHKYFVKK